MTRYNSDEQQRYGQEAYRPERRSRPESAEWDDERSGFGREDRPLRGHEEQRYGARRHDLESERERGAGEPRGDGYGGGRRSWPGDGWSGSRPADAYGERGRTEGERERDPGRDFGSEGYGVESGQYERRGGKPNGGGQGHGQRGYGDRGADVQSRTQRGFGGEGYEGRGYGEERTRGEERAYGLGREGAGGAPGRGWDGYDESGHDGRRAERWSRGDERGMTGGGADFLDERRRQAQGRFAGLGPKGYERSDDRIREDVCDRLMQDPEIDASELVVGVQAGEVTLDGTVDSKDAKRLAEDVAEDVSGVREVHNRLRVDRQLGRSSSRSTHAAGPSTSVMGSPANVGGNTGLVGATGSTSGAASGTSGAGKKTS